MGEVVVFPGGPPRQRPIMPPLPPMSKVVWFLMDAAHGEHSHLLAQWERALIAGANQAPRLTPNQKMCLRGLVNEFFDRRYQFKTQNKQSMGDRNHEC